MARDSPRTTATTPSSKRRPTAQPSPLPLRRSLTQPARSAKPMGRRSRPSPVPSRASSSARARPRRPREPSRSPPQRPSRATSAPMRSMARDSPRTTATTPSSKRRPTAQPSPSHLRRSPTPQTRSAKPTGPRSQPLREPSPGSSSGRASDCDVRHSRLHDSSYPIEQRRRLCDRWLRAHCQQWELHLRPGGSQWHGPVDHSRHPDLHRQPGQPNLWDSHPDPHRYRLGLRPRADPGDGDDRHPRVFDLRHPVEQRRHLYHRWLGTHRQQWELYLSPGSSQQLSPLHYPRDAHLHRQPRQPDLWDGDPDLHRYHHGVRPRAEPSDCDDGDSRLHDSSQPIEQRRHLRDRWLRAHRQ